MQHRKSVLTAYQAIPEDDGRSPHGPPKPCTVCGGCCVLLGGLLALIVSFLLIVVGYNAIYPIRASCAAEFNFSHPCFEVAQEVSRRIHGQHLSGADAWHDPHNNGSYAFIHVINPPLFNLIRISGTASRQKYTDIVNLSFSVVGSGNGSNGTCQMSAQSTSTVFSILDFSTNWCNIINLVSSDPRARPFTKLNYTVAIGQCGEKDTNRCLTV